MISKLQKRDKGFTLIELMIVIAIIGILAAIAIPNFVSYRKRSYDAAATADIKNLYTACQAYFTDNPAGACTATDAASYGFTQTSNVLVGIGTTDQTAFAATSQHSSSTRIYSISAAGAITNNGS